MSVINLIGQKFSEELCLKYHPVGLFFSDNKPINSIGFKEGSQGCIMPLIFQSAKGKTVVIGKDSHGYPCA